MLLSVLHSVYHTYQFLCYHQYLTQFTILTNFMVHLKNFLNKGLGKLFVNRFESLLLPGMWLIQSKSYFFNSHRKYCLTLMCLICLPTLQLLAKSTAPLSISYDMGNFTLSSNNNSVCIKGIIQHVLCTCNSCTQLGFSHRKTSFCVSLVNITGHTSKEMGP